ncbi:MAG: VOC family protein [Bdellovibrionales bacterium]
MKAISTYLNFDGNCAEAMKFYQKCLKADLELMPFSEMPGDVPPASKNRIMHARLTKGGAVLMASDTMPGMPFTLGNNFSVSIHCESKAEVDEFLGALKEGGKVTMPAAEMFWGAYFGMCTDKFGVNWMFNCELAQR